MARRMLIIARPTVVLPLPDSPTRPSVSPLFTVNDTPLTACTSPCLRRSRPPKTGNLTCRFLTSRIGGMPASLKRRRREGGFVGDSVEMAPDKVAGSPLYECGLDVGAGLEAIGAAGRELAAFRQV